MVHATVGMGRTLGMALDRQNMSYQLDPTAAVAYLMSSSGGSDSRGEIVPASGTTVAAAFHPVLQAHLTHDATSSFHGPPLALSSDSSSILVPCSYWLAP